MVNQNTVKLKNKAVRYSTSNLLLFPKISNRKVFPVTYL